MQRFAVEMFLPYLRASFHWKLKPAKSPPCYTGHLAFDNLLWTFTSRSLGMMINQTQRVTLPTNPATGRRSSKQANTSGCDHKSIEEGGQWLLWLEDKYRNWQVLLIERAAATGLTQRQRSFQQTLTFLCSVHCAKISPCKYLSCTCT